MVIRCKSGANKTQVSAANKQKTPKIYIITFYNWVLSTLRFTPVQYIDSGVVGGESIEILNKSPAGTVAIVTFVEIGTSHRSQVLYDLR